MSILPQREHKILSREKPRRDEFPTPAVVLLVVGLLLFIVFWPDTTHAKQEPGAHPAFYSAPDRIQEAYYCEAVVHNPQIITNAPSMKALVDHCEEYL